MMRRLEHRRGDRPRRPRMPRRGSVGRGGAVAGASRRLRGRARKRLERPFASPRLPGRLAGRPDCRRRRAARDFAGARGDPLRRPRRNRSARLRPRLRRPSQAGRDLRDRAVLAEGKLYHRRARLLPASPGRGGSRRARRDKRTGADDGRRSKDARLLHEPGRFRRAARRRAAPASSTRRPARPPSSSSVATPSAARRSRRAGPSTPMDSRPPILRRRSAARCSRSAARGAPISR